MKLFKFVIFTLFFPLITNASPISSEKLFSNEKYTMVKLSPMGRFTSFYSKEKKNHYIKLLDVETNKLATSLEIGNDNDLEAYTWLNDKSLFINMTRRQGDLNVIAELVEKDQETSFKIKVVKTKGYLVHLLPLQPDKVMFAKKKDSSIYFDLFIINIADLARGDFSQATEVEHNKRNVIDYFYDANFKRVITSKYDSDNGNKIIQYIPIAGGKWKTILTIKETDYHFEALNFIDANTVAVLTNKDSDKIVLRSFDLQSKTLNKTLFQHPKYDLVSANFSNLGQLNYVSFMQHGLKQFIYFDRQNEHLTKRLSKTFSEQEVYLIDESKSKELLLLYINGSTNAGEYLLYNSKKDTAQRLFSAYPALDDLAYSKTKPFTVKSADGTEIEAFLTLPTKFNQKTLLVFPHGGPIGIQENNRFNEQIQYYASRGFAILRVNFRGSSGFGKGFLTQGIGEFGKLIEQDINTALDHVLTTNKFDYMCSIGASYGGYSAAMLAIKSPKKYDCIVGAFGIYDLPLLFNASNYRSDEEFQKRIAKVVGDFSASLVDVSPVYLADKVLAPILLIAGRADDIADFEHSNRFNYVLKQRKKNVDTLFYNGIGHGHNHWNGDKHQAAYTTEFIMRSLNLTYPAKENLSKSELAALSDDHMHLAYRYAGGKLIKTNHQKALFHYQQAAELNNPRANYNTGVYYNNGEHVKKDFAKSVSYFKKSAALNYASAHSKLGLMYMSGEFVEKDWDKALFHLLKAQEIDDNPKNNIRLARFYCIAPESLKNVSKCLELMELRQYKKHSMQAFNQALKRIRVTLSWVFAQAELTEEEHQQIKQFAVTTFAVTETQADIQVKESGTFTYISSDEFNNSGQYEITRKGTLIANQKDNSKRFGLMFNIDVPGLNVQSTRIGITARWFLTTPDGQREHIEDILIISSPLSSLRMFLKPGLSPPDSVYTLELYDFNQKLLFQEQYIIEAQNTEVTLAKASE